MNISVDIPSGCCANTLCPLSQIRPGTSVRIKRLCASPEMTQRLREVGFCEEQIIRPVIAQSNIICQVCNARLAISAAVAQVILVEPVAVTKAA